MASNQRTLPHRLPLGQASHNGRKAKSMEVAS